MAATYTVRQVADILGYSTNSIYTFLKEKRIAGVRVGKGRFRIPQSELDRLLLTSKKASTQATATVSAVQPTVNLSPAAGVADVSGGKVIQHTKILGFVHLGTLNIFDWFIGTAAVVAGLGLFLFNSSFALIPLGQTAPILSVMRAVFIGCGFGILITNVAGQTHTGWHKLFHVLLGVMGLLTSAVFVMGGDIDGAVLYGPMGILVLLATFIHLGGVAWVSIYLTMLTIGINIAALFSGGNPRITWLLSQLPVSVPIALSILSVTSALFIFALWRGYFRNKQLFWIVTWLAAFVYFVIAFWYAGDMYWSRSFFLLVVGVTSLYLSPWEWLAAIKSRKADFFTLGVFTAMFGILLIGIGVVYLMQTNGIATIKRENVYKAQYAKQNLEETLQSVISTVSGVKDNADFAVAVEKKDLATINNTERVIFESNKAIRRLVLLDAAGQGINLYPFGSFDQSDLSGRDYFIRARDDRKPFVSDLFVALTDQSHRNVVSVATPLYNKDRAFIGVLVASLDLAGISQKLQKIAVPDRDEYVVVIDSKGKRIMHPNTDLIGTQIDEVSPVRRALTGQSGVMAGLMYDGKQGVVAYEPVEVFGAHWGVGITSPLAKIYRLSDTSNLSLFGVIVVAVLLAGAILQGGFFWRWDIHLTGESP